VQGHVDGVGQVAERLTEGEWALVWFRCPPELAAQLPQDVELHVASDATHSIRAALHEIEVTLLISLVLGIPLGIISAVKVDTGWDSICKFVAMFGLSVPNFFIGLVMIYVFAVWLRWLPASGWKRR